MKAARISGCAYAVVLIAFSLVATASRAAAQDDLDSMMESDRELDPGERHDDEADEEEEADQDEGFDESGVDHEAPPGDWQGEDASTKKTSDDADDDDHGDDGDDDTPNPLSVGLLVGYGVSLEDANPWSLGFGLRGGYNLGAFFVGGRFVYYIGETITQTRATFSGGTNTEDIATNLWELGAEFGYDIGIDALVIRPGLGIGLASVSVGSASEVYAHLSPGLSILYNVSDTMFIGIDARFQAVLSELGANGVPVLATLGMRF